MATQTIENSAVDEVSEEEGVLMATVRRLENIAGPMENTTTLYRSEIPIRMGKMIYQPSKISKEVQPADVDDTE